MQGSINTNFNATIVNDTDKNPVHFGTTDKGVEYAICKVVVDRRPAKNEPLTDEQAKRNLKGQWMDVITSDQTSIKILKSAKRFSNISVSGEMQLDVAKTVGDKTFRSNRVIADRVRFIGRGKAKPAAVDTPAAE